MTAFNFRSLLLAAIVLSNCITWTASRHHYAHNVHQHRTRHRRQGAGLYLPASYVIPGGEGSGPWGEWGEISPCSRTCGGGVASQKRICLQPEDQSQCRGGDIKYFSCQTQDCPEGSGDFRAEQCAEFNDKLFRGFQYNWVPYTKAPNPCELNCMPHGERFYFRHKLQVTDGTRCNDESFDVCVNGKCQPVGCDMMLNSPAREDKCRECRGNGANCRTTDGIVDTQDLVKGYNDILLIPAGSTSINIEELAPSNNYLALRAKNGTYYLNGHYHIDFPRSITIAGALWTYERSQQGFAAPDKLRCLGPTNEPLYLSLLLQDDNVGIQYEYSVPKNSAPPTDKRYNWVHEQFTPCSATCGGGFQTRNVTCRSREELEIVEDSLCDEGLKPPTNQSCNPDPCPAQWVEGPWGECSQRCGSGGVRSREVTCQKIIANGQNSIVPDKECFDLLGPKPEVFQKCNEDAPCPSWFIGHWKPCDKLCDEGKQTRQVVCRQKKDGRVEVLDDESCAEAKPEEEQPCMLQPCDGIDWVTTSWSGCDSCTSKNRTRVVICSTKGRQVLNESLCSYHNRPKDFEVCKPDELPDCELQWYATQWGKCSVNCGEGVQTRKVFCGMYYEDKTGSGVEIVDDSKCASLPKYKDTKPCTVPKEECPSQWFAGPWSECTETCGGGEQYRRVMCFRGDKEAKDCDGSIVLDSTQLCNPGPCDPDHLLPVNRQSTVVMEDIEDECEEEDYQEVGLDSFTTDLMMSDSTGYAEHESTMETGSGFGSSLSTDDLTTEGSGFSTTDTTNSDYTTYDDTGSGETSITDLPSTAAKDKDTSTTTTVIPLTEEASSESTETSTSDATASAETGSTESTVEETGSTPTSVTKDTESTSPSDSTGSSESTATGITESTPTADTDSTSSDTVSTSSDTGSTSSGETGVTEASGPTSETGSTDGSESTVVKETGSTSESGSTSSEGTGSSDTDATGSTTEAGTESTESSVSTEIKETGSTSESGSTSSGETVATDTSDTGSTGTGETETADSSASTVAKETGSSSETDSTSSGETTPTVETSSTDTDKTESTVSDGTDETTSTGETESTVTETTGPTKSTITEETSPTESTVTEETSSTESTVTEETGSTESTVTDETVSTESTVTEETGSTESTVTEETGSTESTVTEETGSTESTVTEETGSTESTVTEETGSTESTVAEETGSTESTITEETGSTESTVTEKTGSTSISESESTATETTVTGSTKTEETSDTSTESTDSTTTTKLATDSTTTTRAVPTESKSSSTEESTTPLSTESSETTESSTDSSESTVETSTSSGVGSTGTESTSEEAGSSTVESSTTSGSDGTTESGSTISAGSTTEGVESSSLGAETSTTSEIDSTTEAIESTSVASGSTGAKSSTPSGTESTAETTESGSTVGSESTTDSGSTVGSESTTKASGSSTEESSTVSGEITTGTVSTKDTSTDSGSTSESTEAVYSTTEGTTNSGSTEESESTFTGLSTTEGSTGTTIWTTTTVLLPSALSPVCKPRKSKCSKTKFGCCPDRKTAASGPFDEGCEKPHTCKESAHGCCPDGLSPSQGDNNEGCPVEPCADTLFGCCTSDNKTAAQGNDQDGCPPPPPACTTSTYGCCADNETEATGPEKEGCPETETSTTGALTETTTETTESIETSEGSTTSEGTTDVISTTTLDPCNSFEFGCCADNETEASGPDGQGCPCNATEFGCCPDGVSPASGLEHEGCPGPCSTSPHGCCQDDKTPAHGPDFEGCCLLQAFGCCPDNRKPAEGPHLEGCGCQNALHGCCPDNVTIAQGPDNQGCGCQYTEHGCCPDRHTAASGPNNEGCACNTYQFGCCDDGVTTATGPEQQGCHCRESKFGCCGDGETPATGSDGAGCDCSSSRHGCCPDGRTEATGPKFLGCTDAPENKQAACSMSTDPGPCHNFTAMWYYDLAYGGCSRFWYGGCDGNGNRFSTKEDCEDVCVQPSPKDACKLPSVKGACDADYRHWHYNSTLEQCIPFRYGGCLGNANNFDTRELCQKQCEPSSVAGQCNLPIDQGSCAGNYSRWGFNSETNLCEQFIWGGCEGNSNRFSSKAACQMRCTGTQPPQCTQPQDAGKCTEKEALWSFSQSENRCLPFYYSGCGGNDNRFSSREACEQICPSAYVADKCTLPAETGQCSNYRERWFYDTTFKRCRQFYYGGCGGNENNFGTEAECDNSCSEIKTTTTTTTTTTTASPVEPQPEPRPHVTDQAPDRPEFCFNAIDAGPCNNTETRYAYDSELGRCVTFLYGGCAGNQNNFPDEDYCSYYCQPMQDICQLPMLQGPCDESLMRWFYDPTTDSCSQFTYGGCEGNDNRFESLEACENRCRTGPVAPTTPTTTVIVDVPPVCKVPEALENCRYGGVVWFFDSSRHECVSHANQEDGSACRHTGTFSSQEACERSCGAFRGVDVCKQRLDAGPCQSYVTKVYFDPSTGQCHEFIYGGCLGGANRFSSMEECSQVCKSEIADPCTLPAEGGSCNSYILQWYYDPSRDQCSQFVYTGCSGNENRFETQRDCETRCSKRPAATTTTTTTETTPPLQLEESECKTPSSLAPCGNNVTVFYYDSERRQCLVSGIGGCGHPNSYSTEEECERRCGAFRGLDVCGSRLDPGPCRASIPKVYWDALTGSCQPYAYGGCAGGPNRFSSFEDCMNVCGDTGPARACLQEVHTGQRCGAAPAPRWHYSVAHADCVVFAYLGCGGNDNKFRSYSDCADACRVSETRGDDQNNILPQDCTPYRQQCEVLDCQYGVDRFTENGCQRCMCREDPCIRANCQPTERCEAFAVRNPASQEQVYSVRCVAENNEVYVDCEEYETNCSRLRCEYGVQRARLPDGCEKCSCVQVEIDCEPLRQECNQLKCNYGVERNVGSDGCERCTCKEHPCERSSCGADERCVVNQYVNGLEPEPKYTAECRTIVKPGACPMDETTTNEVTCRRECADDADCRGVGKCCRRGCSDLCLVPVEQTSPHPLLTTTVAPNVPAAPQALPQPEPEVLASEGGSAILRCLFRGNPPPKITWTFGKLTIDGNEGRYKLLSDGALEIVSVYRNDTGVYICVADNGLGVATQEIHLVVNDVPAAPQALPLPEPEVVAPEGGSAILRCLFRANPPPKITWTFGKLTIDGNEGRYKLLSDGALEIVSVYRNDTGVYICVADNGLGVATQEIHLVVNDVPAAPLALPLPKPEVEASEGGSAILRCLFHGNPPPKITWTFGELTVDGNEGRYRLLSDGALEIVSLYRNDTGVYICVADNGLGVATQEIHLVVNDPVRMPVGIAGDENAVVTGELGSPLEVRCLAYGYPLPTVFWYRGHNGAMVPYNDAVYLARGNILLIRSLAIETLGQYTCQAYNGEGKAASWVVFVRAYQPEEYFIENELLVPRNTLPPRPRTRPPTTAETTTTITTSTEAPRPLFTVPVSTHVSTPYATLNSGADLRLTCDVDGFPEPDVHWTKDGATIQADGRITITGSTIVSRLTVAQVSDADSGLYTCHASNQYSSQSDTAQINVQQIVVPAKCTDNPFFANCNLIVRSKFCKHSYYSKFCCKSCVEAGQLDPQDVELQADQPYRKK